MTYQHPLAFLLGLEGVALLRAVAGDGFDRDFVQARFDEIQTLLDLRTSTFTDESFEVGQVDTVEGYRAWSSTYDDPGNPLIEVEEPIVCRILDSLPVGTALDAACGTGRYAEFLAARGHRVSGVDSSPDMLARARARVSQATFVSGDLHELPWPDGEFDLVVCGLALTHVPVLAPVMAEFARVLRPGGHLLTSDIHIVSLYLGGVPNAVGPDGRRNLLPANRHLVSDYLAAALPLGFEVRGCAEPRWPPSDHAGGPLAQQWCRDAANAAYTATPAAIVLHFQKAES